MHTTNKSATMEATGATTFDDLEVFKTSSSSDALTWALMQKKAKVKAKKEQSSEIVYRSRTTNSFGRMGSLRRSKSDTKVHKDGFETACRKRTVLVNVAHDEFELSTPIKAKRHSTGASSPGGTDNSSDDSIIETDAENDDASAVVLEKSGDLTRSLSNVSKKSAGFLKKILRKTTKTLRKRVPQSIETNNAGTDAIFQDLGNLQSVNTSTGTKSIRALNTGGKKKKDLKKNAVAKDPTSTTLVLKRATGYKKKAQRLLRQALAQKDEDAANGNNPRGTEAIARKAYRYAGEARRLFDMVKKRTVQQQAEETVRKGQTPVSTPSRSQINASDISMSVISELAVRSPPKVRVKVEDVAAPKKSNAYSVSMFDDDRSVATAGPSFCHKVELDEHQRKIKALELFLKSELLPSWGCSMDDKQRREFYADETEHIIESFDNAPGAIDPSDTLCVMTHVTAMTAQIMDSDRRVREEDEHKVTELQLFAPSQMWSSMLESLQMKKVKEDEEENFNQDGEAVESVSNASDNETRANSFVEITDEESMQMGNVNVCSAIPYNDMVNDDNIYLEDDGTFSDDDTDESTDDDTDAHTDFLFFSSDSDSDDDDDDDDTYFEEENRGVLQRWIDIF
jgi:hypothetical protein